jgi:hypothetical protein
VISSIIRDSVWGYDAVPVLPGLNDSTLRPLQVFRTEALRSGIDFGDLRSWRQLDWPTVVTELAEIESGELTVGPYGAWSHAGALADRILGADPVALCIFSLYATSAFIGAIARREISISLRE